MQSMLLVSRLGFLKNTLLVWSRGNIGQNTNWIYRERRYSCSTLRRRWSSSMGPEPHMSRSHTSHHILSTLRWWHIIWTSILVERSLCLLLHLSKIQTIRFSSLWHIPFGITTTPCHYHIPNYLPSISRSRCCWPNTIQVPINIRHLFLLDGVCLPFPTIFTQFCITISMFLQKIWSHWKYLPSFLGIRPHKFTCRGELSP